MKTSFRISLIACVVGISGCSMIQNWFPDKEKDYQFTTELPPLVIPSDLVQKPSIQTRIAPVEAVISKQTEPTEKLTTKSVEKIENLAPVSRPALAETETELSRNEIQVSLTHENMPTLNLNVPSVRAWRIVGKALGRSNIEVTNRNAETGQVHIQIADSKPKLDSEKSLLDESLSIFDGFVSNETAYILQFHETNAKTAVTLLNAESQPLTDGTDNKVLTNLFDAIKVDLSK
jgi:outer membrane protein assembly factor BamC